MANKRQLKKAITRAIDDVAFACFISECGIKNADSEKFNKVLTDLGVLRGQALKAASFSFDKTPKSFGDKKEYNQAKRSYNKKAYGAFREEFTTRLKKVVDELNALLPGSKKEEKAN